MAGRYAQALFDLAKESKTTEKIAADLATFQAMIDESADMRRFLKSPAFSSEEQIGALTALMNKAGIAGTSANFLKLVASKHRLFAVEDMIRDYTKLNDAEKGVSRAEVTVAEPLKDAHLSAITEALAQVAGSDSVDLTVKVDPSIIGGMIRDYTKLNDAEKGVSRAEVTVAEPLKDAHLSAIKEALAQVAGSDSVDLTVKVDPSIIGGMIVKLGSRMVDSSLKTKLNLLRTRMKEVG